jgi:Fascin domain
MTQTSFKSWQDQYLSAQPDGRIEANREKEGPWELFTVEEQHDGTVAFLSAHGTYLGAEPPELGSSVYCDRRRVGPWECWTPEMQSAGVYAFKSHHGGYLVVEVDQTVRADRTAAGEWESFDATMPVHLEPTPVLAPIIGTLHASYSAGCADDNGPRLVVGCHAGDLLSRAMYDKPAVERSLDEIADAGYQFVRTWTILYGGYWQSFTGEVHPGNVNYWTTVDWYADALLARDLRWLVSQGDLMRWSGTTQGRREYMSRLAARLAPKNVAMGVDACNEGGNNGEGNVEALKAALDAFTDVLPLPIRSLTSTSETDPNRFLVAGVLRDIHSTRDPWPKSGRYPFNVGYEAQPRVWNLQPEGPGYGCQEYLNDRRVGHHVSSTPETSQWNDNDPEIGGCLAALHIIGKALYVWFASPGVISDEPFTNYAAFTAVPKLFALFPANVQGWRTFHGGEGRIFSVDRVLAVPASGGDVRCDHAASGDQRICIPYGPSGSYTMRVVNHFEGVLIHPGTLEQTPVSWRRDQMVTLEWRRGRVLIGRVS